MTSLGRAALLADLEAYAFAAPVSATLTPRRVGAETEFIPVETATWRRCPIEGEGVPATLPFLRRFGARAGLDRDLHRQGHAQLPAAARRDASRSSPAASSSTARRRAARRARCWGCSAPWCCRCARPRQARAITLLAVGIDPANSIEEAPLLLRPRRYARMADYLARRGPGRRAHDAPDGVVPDESGLRRRAVAPLAGAQRRRAIRRGDVRQLLDLRRRPTPAA